MVDHRNHLRRALLILACLFAGLIVVTGLGRFGVEETRAGSGVVDDERQRVVLNIRFRDVQPSAAEAVALVWVSVCTTARHQADSAVTVVLDDVALPEFHPARSTVPPSRCGTQFDSTMRKASLASYYGSETLFPFDSFSVYVPVRISGTGTFAFLNDAGRQDVSGYVNVGLDQSSYGWRLPFASQGVLEATADGQRDSRIVARLERPWSFKIYTVTVALLPVLIGLAFFLRARAHPDGDATASLELASALLALLTLRQVLTPANVTSITLLDNLLAAELAAILLLMLFVYLRAPARV